MNLRVDYSDFSLGNIICEVRYPGAYLIFDRSGSIWHSLKRRFPSLSLVVGTPMQTSFRADSYVFNIESEAARISCNSPGVVDIEEFQRNCSFFFPLVAGILEIPTLTRTGLRQFLVKKFATKEEGQVFLRRFAVARGYIPKWLEGASTTEVLYHWQSESSVAMLRMAMQPGATSIAGVNLLADDNKNECAVFLDLDYYIMGGINLDQWDASEWILQTRHAAKKDVNHFLEEWQ